jgi:ribonuclease HI
MAVECEETPQDDPTSPEEVSNIPSNWRAPRAGWLKANWVATLNNTSMKTGIRVVVQNKSGEVVAALAKVIPFVEDSTTAEAIDAGHAVNLCVDGGFHQVVLQGDSQIVGSTLNHTSPSWSTYGPLLEDTKVKSQSMHQVEIKYVSRVVNFVAHNLTKCAISYLLDELWMEECPSYIQSIVLAEQVSSS